MSSSFSGAEATPDFGEGLGSGQCCIAAVTNQGLEVPLTTYKPIFVKPLEKLRKQILDEVFNYERTMQFSFSSLLIIISVL